MWKFQGYISGILHGLYSQPLPHLLHWHDTDVHYNNLAASQVLSQLESGTKFGFERFSPNSVSGSLYPPFSSFLVYL